MKIVIAQNNPIVGDIDNIHDLMIKQIDDAEKSEMDVIVFPELAVTGYPPRDLLYKPGFVRAQLDSAFDIVKYTKEKSITAIFGYADLSNSRTGRALNNCVMIANDGHFSCHAKTLLPNYDVFDEHRYFEPGEFDRYNFPVFEIAGTKCGAIVCEEMWFNSARRHEIMGVSEDDPLWRVYRGQTLYRQDPIAEYVSRGVKHIFSINASPFRIGVAALRRELVRKQCQEHKISMTCCFQVGGNDEIVFDGSSFSMNENGSVLCCSNPFVESVIYLDTENKYNNSHPINESDIQLTREQEINLAAVKGLRDYATKQGFSKLLVNVSGGIDSALALWYAVKAVGRENVIAFSQPSEFTGNDTLHDSVRVCKNLDVVYDEIPIRLIHSAFRLTVNSSIYKMHTRYSEKVMQHWLGENSLENVERRGVADENIQPRIRGTIIMLWANMVNGLVVSTGNRSEMSVGFCTIYGDLAGGYNVLKDIYKGNDVFACCKQINKDEGREVIPESIINRPPSAELKADQKDMDSLPPYPLLDEIERRYTSDTEDVSTIIETLSKDEKCWLPGKDGQPENFRTDQYLRELKRQVISICAKIDRAEYKRRQSPLGAKIMSRDLSRGRQVPVVQGWTRIWMEQLRDK